MLAYITEIVRKGNANYRGRQLLDTYNGLNAFALRDVLLFAIFIFWSYISWHDR